MKMSSLIAGAGLVLMAATAAAAAPGAETAKPPRTAAATDAPGAPAVEPKAVQALASMGGYLRTLSSFTVRSDTDSDMVTDEGEKLQFSGSNTYQVRRPNGFVIDMVSDRKVRRVVYDGKTLTVFSPRAGFYAQVPAPPTIRQTLDAVYDKYGIAVPLADLFTWGTPDAPTDHFRSAKWVGYARLGDADTDQYAFREGDIDWQIWIQRGARSLPLKVVITTDSVPQRPSFVARLTWKTDQAFAADAFTFTPPADAKPIRLALVEP